MSIQFIDFVKYIIFIRNELKSVFDVLYFNLLKIFLTYFNFKKDVFTLYISYNSRQRLIYIKIGKKLFKVCLEMIGDQD